MVIVTELLLGGTLRKYLVRLRPGRLDTRLAVGFALDIARAMECLHSHGVIHRDLKPGSSQNRNHTLRLSKSYNLGLIYIFLLGCRELDPNCGLQDC